MVSDAVHDAAQRDADEHDQTADNAATERGAIAERIYIAANLTLIVTTSAIRSNPSLDMLTSTLESYLRVLPKECPTILVCDGCFTVECDKPPQHKAGRVTEEEKTKYVEYIRRIREAAAANTGPLSGISILELATRQGFGFAVRAALLHEVRTRFVMIVQHDQQLVRPFDLARVLRTMATHPEEVKYVGLASKTTQHYATNVRGRHGLTLRRTRAYGGLPLLPLLFWYDKPHICCATHYRDFVFGSMNPFHRKLQEAKLEAVKLEEAAEAAEAEEAVAATVASDETTVEEEALEGEEEEAVTEEDAVAEPDETAAERSARRRRFFGQHRRRGDHGLGVVRQGNFIEETFGRAQLADIAANGMAAHAKYGTFQLEIVDDHAAGEARGDDEDDGRSWEEGVACIHVAHVHGRRFLTPEQRAACGWPVSSNEVE